MTAPQHTAKPKTDEEVSSPIINCKLQNYKLQRCLFVGMGLLSSFGFIASQMGFAFAYSGNDFVVGDYAVDAGAGDSAGGNFIVADASLTHAVPSYEAAESQPVPDAFIEVSASTASWASEPQPAAPVAAAPAAPVYVAPEPPPQVAPTPQVAPQPPVAVPQAAVTPVPQSAPATPPAPVEDQLRVMAATTPAAAVSPEVSAVAQPAFTVVKKDAVAKTSRRSGPLAGLMEASAVAAPLSAYVAGQSRTPGVLAVADTTGNGQEGAAVLAMDAGADALAPELEPAAPQAVPDILPEPDVLPEVVPEATLEALPAPEAAAPIVEVAPEVAPPVVEAPPVAETDAPIQATELVPGALPDGTSVFVDPTDYSVGATTSPDAAPDVVISDQSTGCEFTVGAGQGVPNGACGTAEGDLTPAPAPLAVPNSQQAPIASQPAQPAAQPAPVVASEPSVNVGPVSFSASGIQFTAPSTTAAGREYLNRSVRPLVNLQAAQQFIFPLAIPSPITSLFGFRIHPITGEHRFHGGTDIGAAQGTPVLAAQDGVVEAAAYAGGYGLMVELSHEVEEMQLRSRYAHLAEILVESGKEVKKGDVIGLVGSTGNSTGPHLHFEMMQATADGWVLVNANGLVQNSLANLVKALNNPMQAMNFSLADFNLNRVNGLNAESLNTTVQPNALTETPSPGQNGISFRPAQPNAS